MILLALPFSGSTLTVVKPDGYQIDSVVYRKAAKHGVEVKTVSLGLFSPGELEKLSLCCLVPVMRHDPESVYSREVEESLGQSQTDNRDLVPHEWLDIGKEML